MPDGYNNPATKLPESSQGRGGDLVHHARGVTFLTTGAGTAVLGLQFAVLTPSIAVAAGLWVFAVLLC